MKNPWLILLVCMVALVISVIVFMNSTGSNIEKLLPYIFGALVGWVIAVLAKKSRDNKAAKKD